MAGELAEVSRNPRIDGISFRYLHFYGSPLYVQDNPLKWYTRAVRAVRTGRGIVSVGDALKFRRMDGDRARRVREYRSPVRVFHYGWARPPEIMVEKQRNLDRLWNDDAALADKYSSMTAEKIYSDNRHLVPFRGTHPALMAQKVAQASWKFEPWIDGRPRLVRIGIALLARPFQKLLKRLGV